MEEKHGGTWRLVGVGRVATGPGGSVPSCLTFVLSRPILSNLTVSCLVLSLLTNARSVLDADGTKRVGAGVGQRIKDRAWSDGRWDVWDGMGDDNDNADG